VISTKSKNFDGNSTSYYNAGMSPEQCRAARAWLSLSQAGLAARAQVSASTIRDFEAGRRIPHPNNLAAIRGALEAAGLSFQFAADGSALGIARAPAPKKGRAK
jgi:DNA-binding transcriptional regulator YiaG